MEINFSNLSLPSGGVALIAVYQDDLELADVKRFSSKAIAEFSAKKGEFIIASSPEDVKLDCVILIGLGKKDDFSELDAEEVGAGIYSYLKNHKISEAAVIINEAENLKISTAEMAVNMAFGVKLKAYRFDKYLTKKRDDFIPKTISFRLETHADAKDRFARLDPIYQGIVFARNLVSEPANKLTTIKYAEIVKTELSSIGIKVDILGEDEMRKMGMNALLAVGQGSRTESQLVVMQWQGGNKTDKPCAFVGKGVVFDTGGISLKPSLNMDEMKGDMGGSAAVVGVMKALALRKAPVNAIGVIGLVENMPDGNAQRPGDIVTSMSGQTIEVLNTDAEGRLVLADALWYTQETFKPQFVIDLATLTGAIIIALSDIYAGLFSNADDLSEQLFKSGEKTGEKLWRFPIHKEYDKMINSPNADMQNISNRRGAGSITAAQFLKRFIKAEVKWAHLDIAGTAMIGRDTALAVKGATGFGVRLLNQLVTDYYESKTEDK